MSRRTLVALFVLGAALAWVIQGHLPLIFLFLLVPAERLGGRKRYWLGFTALVLVAAGAEAAWQFAQLPVYSPSKAGVDAAAQARLILDHPRQFGTALKTALGQPPLVNLLGMTHSGVWAPDGWQPSVFYVLLCWLPLLCVCFLDGTPAVSRVRLHQRLVPLAVGALAIFVIFLLSYLTWMPVGASTIFLRPRQALPAVLALLLCLFNLTPRLSGFAASVRAHLGLLLVVYFLLRYAEGVLSVAHRYYGWPS